jgi:hypothetical protein
VSQTHDEKTARQVIVIEPSGGERRYALPNFGLLKDGALVIGTKTGDDIEVDAMYGPGHWKSARKDHALAPDSQALAIGIAKRALEQIAGRLPMPDDGPETNTGIARQALEEIFEVMEL